MTHPKSFYENKIVCVTGAGGSIGSEICRRLVSYGVAKLIMVGHSEKPLYDIHRELAPTGARLEVVLGSVTDGKLMHRVTRFTDVVIHAAAHKHVPMCEENPTEAVLNNVGGTAELLTAAGLNHVGTFILISTDKAVKPKGVMGATKRACELLAQREAQRSPDTRFVTVRFGNVIDSSGSVLPLWREQLAQGKPITLTDSRCTRYFMSIPDAAQLALGAGSLGQAGTYVLDMGPLKSLYRMALELVTEHYNDLLGCPEDLDPNSYINETGLRPGEKLTEELDYGGDRITTKIPRVFRIEEKTRLATWNEFNDLLMAARCRHRELTLDALWRIVR